MSPRRSTPFSPVLRIARPVGVWAAIVAATLLAGAIAGAALRLAAGLFSGSEQSAADLALSGADLGVRYARVWAGGLAIVLCFIKEKEKFSVREKLRARFSRRDKAAVS